MKKALVLMLIAVLGLVAFGVADEVKTQTIEVKFTTNITARVATTNVQINGFIEEVMIDLPAALTTVATTKVDLVAVNWLGEDVNLATNNAAIADWVARPRVKTTSPGGTATTTDTKYLALGDSLRLSVTNVDGSAKMSNVTVKAHIKTSRAGGQ